MTLPPDHSSRDDSPDGSQDPSFEARAAEPQASGEPPTDGAYPPGLTPAEPATGSTVPGTPPAAATPLPTKPGLAAVWRRLAITSDPGETALHAFLSLLLAAAAVIIGSFIVVIPFIISEMAANGGEPVTDLQALLLNPAFVLLSLLATQIPLAVIGWWRSRGLDRSEREVDPAEVFGEEERPPRRSAWSTRGAIGFGVLIGAIALAVTMVVGVIQERLGFPVVEQEAIVAILEGGGWPMIAFAILGTTFVPLSEEIFFRHYLFRRIVRGFGYWPAAIVSALAFAGIHFNPSGILAYVSYGLLFAWGRQRSGRTLACVVGHVTVNATTFGIYLISQQLGIDIN